MELFPETDRVIYRKNPLAQVSCRVRFGELLEIRAGEPVEFHRAIRDKFPMVNRQRLADEDNTVLREFISPKGAWKVRLAPYLLEVTTNEYEQWEAFSKTAFQVIDAFTECYAPGRFNRVNLRYTDVIQRQPTPKPESQTGFGRRLADVSELVSDASARPEPTSKERVAEALRQRIEQRDHLTDISIPVRQEPMWSHETWLDWMFNQTDAPIAARLDAIFDRVDEWLLAGNFEKADEIFRLLRQQFFQEALGCTELTLGFLTVTHGAQEHLSCRRAFIVQLRNALVEREGESRTRALLGGLD
jgi:uncharacterized protein (TIGR04255 family)